MPKKLSKKITKKISLPLLNSVINRFVIFSEEDGTLWCTKHLLTFGGSVSSHDFCPKCEFEIQLTNRLPFSEFIKQNKLKMFKYIDEHNNIKAHILKDDVFSKKCWETGNLFFSTQDAIEMADKFKSILLYKMLGVEEYDL